MLFCSRSRALCAVILFLFLFSLCACTAAAPSASPAPSAPTAAPEEAPIPALSGRWTGSLDIGSEVSAALGFDLTPWLEQPLTAVLRLEILSDGVCTLTRDDAACAPALRAALAACVRSLQEQEDGEELSGLALAEALGADPNDFAAALCDELLSAASVTSGRYVADRSEIVWRNGSIWPLAPENGALRVALPDTDELLFSPAD